ncbi:coniferyl aldehyde dehydrogenase [Piscinibacter terrae]|uniref:Aldehyde dehydrogenase n=1 Tax=Piscinibacter terrae TaxID=2496871 RepID=A0A3N7HNL7_9BURK|nr:coniferyl aldehyde dehydrogenase [Albitalea terrae]RQP22696.1 coniferyl aldehyde dehydrogenase [Albitalea terrae]
MNQTIEERLRLALQQQRAAFDRDPMPSEATRRDRLGRVHAMTTRHADALAQAIAADFGHRARQETLLAEVFTVRSGTRHALSHLRRWMKPRRVPTQLHFLPGHNTLMPQPLGVVGIVSPWNYPYYLTMAPAIAALAAGNRVLIKPSELTPETSALMAKMIAADFADDEMQVITGDAAVGRAFVELPFDHLFFTGSTAVGRLVAQAAARNLTPVTLELGGKSPAIVDASSDLQLVADRLAFGKLFNAGQTCVAPDYALAPQALVEPLAERLVQSVRKLYPTLSDNPDYTAIVSERHRARLQGLLDDAQAKGARLIPTHSEAAANGRFVPHVLTNVNEGMAVMQEEIFGPILPIVGCSSADDAIAKVRSRDRPLALYWFGRDTSARERVMAQTHAGGVTINDCIWHLGQENQPFGGVGASGIGSYHGEWGFRTFSKDKPIFHQPRLAGTSLFSPPYGARFDRLLGLLQKLFG